MRYSVYIYLFSLMVLCVVPAQADKKQQKIVDKYGVVGARVHQLGYYLKSRPKVLPVSEDYQVWSWEFENAAGQAENFQALVREEVIVGYPVFKTYDTIGPIETYEKMSFSRRINEYKKMKRGNVLTPLTENGKRVVVSWTEEALEPLRKLAFPEPDRSGKFDWVDTEKLRIGMTVEEMRKLLGWPDKENRTVTAAGEKIQFVYRRKYETAYVYTVNGIVTAWQD